MYMSLAIHIALRMENVLPTKVSEYASYFACSVLTKIYRVILFISPIMQMWYPCGSFKGDERSAALAQSYRDGNLLSSISKNQLDSGVANAIAQDIEKFEEQLFRGLPQLRKSKGDLEYGYRLAFEGLSEEQKKMNIIVPEKREGFMEKVKGFFGQ